MSQRDGARPTILVVDDDPATATAVMDVLACGEQQVVRAASGTAALAALDEARPDLVILELMLPDGDGLLLCPRLRERSGAPILVCSRTRRRRDPLLALELGADDFVAKPYDLDELEARVRVALRRAAARGAPEVAPSAQVYRIGALVVDCSRRRVTLGGTDVPLTPTEYRLLVALAGQPDAVRSREELAQQVWGYQDVGSSRAMDVHVRHLRVKLAAGAAPAPPIVAVRGFGYKLVSDGSGSARESTPDKRAYRTSP
jgi:DNA-binding response OmpR family regulator